MKALEFIPEEWFSDLDSNALALLGYGVDKDPKRTPASRVDQQARVLRSLRKQRSVS